MGCWPNWAGLWPSWSSLAFSTKRGSGAIALTEVEMQAAQRYLRLFGAMARFGLLREMAFRGNFIVKMLVELLWLGILLAFYRIIFTKTALVADWSEWQYLFFVGCFYAVD